MIIDTHAHINFKAFNDDAHKIIHKSLDENTWMILVGSDNKTSKRALELANRYERGVYVAVGLHPIHVDDEFFSYDIYEKLAQFDKTVAVGEIGLDYYHINKEQDIVSVKRKQKDLFLNQLKLARSMNLPAIIHCRQAHDDMIEILEDFKKENKNLFPDVRSWGVMHCFSGDENLAWKYFSLGLIISFTGIITFSRQWD
ncbi:MAG: TatD family hydrolase, partial [Candidatus Falkowbacteria bacterium]